MGMTAGQYAAQLRALLPRGAAWLRDAGGTLGELLRGLVGELARVDGRADDLRDEADPRSTYELLPEWETAFGLPDPCVPLGQTTQQRRDALWGKVASVGGQSRQYYVQVAAALGYEITIDEADAHTVNSRVDEAVYGQDWQFLWVVYAPETSVDVFTVESGADEALRTWGNELLECVINRLKPAHTQALFAYGSG